eukprot:1142865-Pelagomonas_calceolata.AAC.2
MEGAERRVCTISAVAGPAACPGKTADRKQEDGRSILHYRPSAGILSLKHSSNLAEHRCLEWNTLLHQTQTNGKKVIRHTSKHGSLGAVLLGDLNTKPGACLDGCATIYVGRSSVDNLTSTSSHLTSTSVIRACCLTFQTLLFLAAAAQRGYRGCRSKEGLQSKRLTAGRRLKVQVGSSSEKRAQEERWLHTSFVLRMGGPAVQLNFFEWTCPYTQRRHSPSTSSTPFASYNACRELGVLTPPSFVARRVSVLVGSTFKQAGCNWKSSCGCSHCTLGYLVFSLALCLLWLPQRPLDSASHGLPRYPLDCLSITWTVSAPLELPQYPLNCFSTVHSLPLLPDASSTRAAASALLPALAPNSQPQLQNDCMSIMLLASDALCNARLTPLRRPFDAPLQTLTVLCTISWYPAEFVDVWTEQNTDPLDPGHTCRAAGNTFESTRQSKPIIACASSVEKKQVDRDLHTHAHSHTHHNQRSWVSKHSPPLCYLCLSGAHFNAQGATNSAHGSVSIPRLFAICSHLVHILMLKEQRPALMDQ